MVSSGIGTLNESSLHAELKLIVAEPGDVFEHDLEGFVVDIRRGERLIEIQTRSFAAMGRKLDTLLGRYPVEVVHPVAVATYLHKEGRRPRKSPKRGSRYSVLDELVSIPSLLDHPNFTLEVVLVTVDAVQVEDPKARRGRGGWRVVDRRLRTLEDRFRLEGADDLLAWLPVDVGERFTTADIAGASDLSRGEAQKLAYCLRALERIQLVDHTRAGHHYERR